MYLTCIVELRLNGSLIEVWMEARIDTIVGPSMLSQQDETNT